MDFGELLSAAGAAGFEVVDANGLPVVEEMEEYIDDTSAQPIHIVFREDVRESERAIVADIHVGEEIYHLVGDPHNVEEFRTTIGGIARPEGAPWD